MKTGICLLWMVLTVSVACAQQAKYLDPNVPLSERVNDLISRMSLEQKVSQLMYEAPAIPGLGIPAYNWWNEALHGVARNGIATSFPQAIALASTWDKHLMLRVGNAISDEARAKYNFAVSRGRHGQYQGLTFWSPNINIFRDPRWGRGMETYGEDPFLTGQIAVQFIKGLQGNNPDYYKVIATSKHFAVHSGPESERHTFDVQPSEYDLRETYLPAFKMTVQEGKVASLMCAYNSLHGKACCSNDPLLNNILRNEWGFKGYVVSDCGAITDIFKGHQQAADAAHASAIAVKAGTDLECGDEYEHLVKAVKKGLLPEADIDTSLKRLLTARFKLGMFDPKELVPYSGITIDSVDTKTKRQLAEKAARESIVLLKNDKHTLPLKKELNTIAVIGPNADYMPGLMGNYNGFPSNTVTPLMGIKNKVSPETRVIYEPGCEIAPNMPLMELLKADYLFADTGKKQKGLKAEYYSNTSMEGEPAAIQIDTLIDLNQWTGVKDGYSVRWTGYLSPPVGGKYTLGIWSGNNFELYLDDKSLTNGDGDYSTKDVILDKNLVYKIKVEIKVSGPKAQMQLLWSRPDDSRETRALEAAKQADVVVFCAGLSPDLEGEEMDVKVPGFDGGDRTTLDLPSTQETLLKKITALGKPVVLVLVNGSALSINWEKEHLPAIVESWYGGQAVGTALADVMFGDYNPGGRLPVTFYKSVDQLPDFHNYNMKGRTYRYFEGEVLYPFGYGLSYTSFAYGKAKISGKLRTKEPVKVTVDVTNTGKLAGDEVVQLYVKGKGTKNNDAIKSLKGFERIYLQAGQTKTVEFTITPDLLTSYKEGAGFTLDKGEHILMIGSSSADKDLKEVRRRWNE